MGVVVCCVELSTLVWRQWVSETMVLWTVSRVAVRACGAKTGPTPAAMCEIACLSDKHLLIQASRDAAVPA